MNKFFKNIFDKKNRGSSLTTVIIVVAFMSILATISLYISGANIKMKLADYSTKKTFYYAEEVVELFETTIVKDVSNAADQACKISGCKYIELGASSNRQGFYYDNFQKCFESEWANHWYSPSETLSQDDAVKKEIEELFPGASYVRNSYNKGTAKFTITLNGQTLYCTLNMGSNDSSEANLLNNGYFAYSESLDSSKYKYKEGVVSEYYIMNLDITVSDKPETDKAGYVSHIITSFKITPPAVNWSENTSLLDTDGSTITSVDFSDTVSYYDWTKE